MKMTIKNNIDIYVNQASNPKGTVIFSHAFVENHRYYTSVKNKFLNNNYNFISYDLQGHLSTTIHHTTMQDYVLELKEIVTYAHIMSDVPVYLVGFSLGALISTLYGLFYPTTIKASVIIGTPLRANKVFTTLEKELYTIEEFLELLNTQGDAGIQWLLSHKTVEQVSNVFLEDIFYTSPKLLLDSLVSYKVPTLVMCGELDPMISYTYSIAFADKTNNPCIIYPNMFHDLLRVENNSLVYQDIFSFLDSF